MSLLGEWAVLLEKALGEGYYVSQDFNPDTCSTDMDFIVSVSDGEIARVEPVGPPAEGEGAAGLGVYIEASWLSPAFPGNVAGVHTFESAARIIHARAELRRVQRAATDARRRLGG